MAVCYMSTLCLDVFVIDVVYSVLCVPCLDVFVTYMRHFHTWCIVGSISVLRKVVSLPTCGPGTSFSSQFAFVATLLCLLLLAFGFWSRHPLVDGGSPVPEQVTASLLGGVQAACCVTVPSCCWHSYCFTSLCIVPSYHLDGFGALLPLCLSGLCCRMGIVV